MTASPETSFSKAFTLVELIVSVALLSLIVLLTTQMLGEASRTTQASSKRIDAASQARIFLDRFAYDFGGAIRDGGLTTLYYGDNANEAGNSSIGFICNSRPRTTTSAFSAFFRGAAIGFRVEPYTDNGRSFPMVGRGDGRLLYKSTGTNATYRFDDLFKKMGNDLVSGSETILNYQSIGAGLFKMHVSFLLNDGTIVQTPPRYKDFLPTISLNANAIPVAFSTEDSADPAKRFVVALIVGTAVLDTQSRDLGYSISPTFLSSLSSELKRPTQDGQTPLAVWSSNLAASTAIQPVKASIRFYERMFRVN